MTTPAPQQPAINHTGPTGADTHRFLALDGLRGIAAFAVIMDHVPSGLLGDLSPGRYLAVDFFFVLSGFVLAHAYGQRLESGWSPWAFIRARLIRLYPLYLAGLLIGVAVATFATLKGWGVFKPGEIGLIALCGLLFLPTPPVIPYAGGQLFPLIGPAWSLFFELIANIVYAFIARVLSWRFFAIFLPVTAALTALTVMNHPDVGGPGWLWQHFDAGLSRVLFDFFAGVAIYRLRSIRKLPSIPAWAAALVFIAIIMVPATGIWRPAFDAFAGIVLMPALVMLASGARVSGITARACAALGILSYGVYVLHVPIRDALQLIMPALHIQLSEGPLALAAVAVTATIAAALAHILYDVPVRRWLTKALPGGAKRKKTHTVAGELG